MIKKKKILYIELESEHSSLMDFWRQKRTTTII